MGRGSCSTKALGSDISAEADILVRRDMDYVEDRLSGYSSSSGLAMREDGLGSSVRLYNELTCYYYFSSIYLLSII